MAEVSVQVAVANSSKVHRFAPTRALRASYDAVVPEALKSGDKTGALRDILKLREQQQSSGVEKKYPVSLPPVESPADDGNGEDSELPWPARLQGPLFRKIAVLRRALYLASKESREAEDGLWALVESARESPAVTARTLSRHMPGAPKLEEVVPSGVVKCAGGVCDRQALPFSRFCLLHISRDEDQALYASCTAPEAGSTLCGSTVLDFLLNQPLCSKHVTKAALEFPMQQKKKMVVTSKATKPKGRAQKVRKTKISTKIAVAKPTPSASSTSLPTLPNLSSTSSWSSGESDGEHPVISGAKRRKIAQQSSSKSEQRLPFLTPEALELSLPSIPLPSLILPPPLPDIGKFMDDSSSEEDT